MRLYFVAVHHSSTCTREKGLPLMIMKKKKDLGYSGGCGVELAVVAFPDIVFGDTQMLHRNSIGQFVTVEHFAPDLPN
ncbi:hypothetical protein Csa_008982 [Cucumis sativus]|uniref:Uncharacterized protein n=1 Tax=Cucumis sativus TaxID=3659 RepID=A0A0A0KQD0_CUCSA|nr:hypothetical protein Csa_008982 [Cucumis sativus]